MSCQIPYAYGRVGGVCQILGLPKYMEIAPNLVKLLLQISTASFHLVFHTHVTYQPGSWYGLILLVLFILHAVLAKANISYEIKMIYL